MRFRGGNDSILALTLWGFEQADPSSRPNCTSPTPIPRRFLLNPLYRTDLRRQDKIL